MRNNLLNERIRKWLIDRGIASKVLLKYNIGYENKHIVIPVHDEHGEKLFNKYRRDPEVTEGPKYRYEKGATATLYGTQWIDKDEPLIICEGELDVLCLASHGFQAVTSTGGAGTFKEEWLKYLPEHVFICLDTDEAGFKSAFKIHKMIPNSRIVSLPETVNDVTDYFLSGKTENDFKSLIMNSKQYSFPPEWRNLKYKKDLMKAKNVYATEIGKMMDEARKLRGEYLSDSSIMYVKDLWMEEFEKIQKAIKFFSYNKKNAFNKDRIAAAKEVPIDRFVEFGRDGFGKCVWHTDNKPSMYWYKQQGRVKCFSCGKLGDVIDVVQAMHGVPMREAINIILGDNGEKK